MKKSIQHTLGLLVATFFIAACGKTTNKKISHDWKVDTFTFSNTVSFADGSSTVTEETGTSTSFKRTTTHSNSDTTTTNVLEGTIVDYTIAIRKDGTWEASYNSTYDINYNFSGVEVVRTADSTNNSSGTWSFVGTNKTDEFKKNERIVFNTINTSWASKITLKYPNSTDSKTNSESNEYKVGENTKTWTVSKSDKENLTLTADVGGNWTSTIDSIYNSGAKSGNSTISFKIQ